jgi:hypothetical protein
MLWLLFGPCSCSTGDANQPYHMQIFVWVYMSDSRLSTNRMAGKIWGGTKWQTSKWSVRSKYYPKFNDFWENVTLVSLHWHDYIGCCPVTDLHLIHIFVTFMS